MKLLNSIKTRWGKKNKKKPPPSKSQTKKRRAHTPKLFALSTTKLKKIAPPQTLPTVQEKIYVHKQEGFITRNDILKPSPKLKSSLEGFILDQRSVHTQNAYSKDIKRFVKFLIVKKNYSEADEPLDRALFIQYKNWLLKEKLEHTTIDRHLATLRSLMNWFCEESLIEKNPLDKVRFLNPGRISKTNAFTDEEVKKILSIPNLHTRIGAQHYAILMVLFYCGIRRSELCALKTNMIHHGKGVRFFNLVGKGNKERLIPLKTPVWNALKYYFLITGRHPRDDRFLFAALKLSRSKNTLKAFDPSMIFYIVKKYAKLAGIIRKVSPHSCRATAISNARDHLVSDRAIQEFAGWSSPDMITRYDKRKTALEQSAAFMIQYGEAEGEGIQIQPEWLKHAETLWQNWDKTESEKKSLEIK